MKKTVLTAVAVFTFLAYGIYQRNQTSVDSIIRSPQADSNKSDAGSPGSQNNLMQKSDNLYKDGSYTGEVADAFYGNIQVQVIIKNAKITAVVFLQYPNDRLRSVRINTQAMPILSQEAIQAQNVNVDIVSGATDTSRAFIQSLNSALTKAL